MNVAMSDPTPDLPDSEKQAVPENMAV